MILGVILVLALVLRAYRLGKPSLWLDEILTIQLSTGRGYAQLDFPQDRFISEPNDLTGLKDAPGWWRIWTTLDRDVHPPLFYIVLRGWREILGDGDVAIRTLSVVLSAAAIGMLYLAVKPLSGEAPALWACLLMALAGPQIEYAQENRSYMLLLVCVLGAAAAVVRIERLGPGRLRGIALALAVLTALLTHYVAVPALLTLLVYVGLRVRGRALRGCMLAFLAAGALFAIAWGPFGFEQMRGLVPRIQFTADGDNSILQTVRRVAELPLRLFTQSPIRPAWIGCFAGLLYVLPGLMLRRRRDLLLWWIWLVGYVLILAASDLARGARGLEWIRYTLVASPAVYALAAAMLADARGWGRHVVPAVLAIACVAALPAAYEPRKADWRRMAHFFASRASENDLILVQSAGADDWRARCLYLCLRFYAPRPLLPVAFVSQADDRMLLPIGPRNAWLFGLPDQVRDKPLPSGWRVVELDADPMAGTVAHLRYE